MSTAARRAWWLGVLLLMACTQSPPPPKPIALQVPPPPEPRPGSLFIYPTCLPESRATEILDTFRAAEAKVLVGYQQELTDDISLRNSALAEGRLQVRVGINSEGKVASVTRVYTELNDQLGS